ncbi:MAG TPA: RDD family protein [Candidatus Sulfotelmatobacter sp.]|nr:RDD family protein [Candidatus Sulfotelmatobacter sp.]
MNSLRMVLTAWVILLFVLFYRISIRQIGFSIHKSDDAYHVSVGSHPFLLGWSIIAVFLFLAIMHIEGQTSEDGMPGLRRRFLAFLIDFIFSLAVTSTFAAMIALLIECSHARRFTWSFERSYSLPTDNTILFPLVVLTMALMFLYFVWPLTRGKQTVGAFIMRLSTTPPFGNKGRFTFREAARRVWFEFRGFTLFAVIKPNLDGQGRTWYDRETNCRVRLIRFQ